MTSPEEFVLLLQSESGWYQLAQDNTDLAELGELLLRGRVELVGKKIQVLDASPIADGQSGAPWTCHLGEPWKTARSKLSECARPEGLSSLFSRSANTCHPSAREQSMGKIVSNFFISLDGVVEAPDQWHFPYFDDQMGAAVGAGMETAGAFLMGRKLYEEWSEYWPTSTDDVDLASFFNNIRKYVVSNTLEKADWNNTTVISGDVAAGLREAREQTDGDIQMSGSATTVRWLLASGLLDELRLLVHPIVVGYGQRLFEDTAAHPLKLVKSETFKTGVLNLVYTPDAA